MAPEIRHVDRRRWTLIMPQLPTRNSAARTEPHRWLELPVERLEVSGERESIVLPSGPTTVALDDDGVLWFTLGDANAIGRINPDGSDYCEYPIPTPASSPRIIALGADGNMWFSEHNAGQIGRITPDGRISEFALSSRDSQPRAIALAADGNIWIGLFAAGRLARITPAGELTEFDLPTANAGPRLLLDSIGQRGGVELATQ